MPTKRITVSVPEAIEARIKQAAGGHHSVSEWVTRAVTRTLEEHELEQRFLEFCDGVKASAAEQRRAQASFEQVVHGKQARRGRRGARRGKKAA